MTSRRLLSRRIAHLAANAFSHSICKVPAGWTNRTLHPLFSLSARSFCETPKPTDGEEGTVETPANEEVVVKWHKVKIPKFNDSMANVTVTKWIKNVGDSIKPGENLCEIETDIAFVELEADTAGFLALQAVPEGEEASVGSYIALVVHTEEEIAVVQECTPEELSKDSKTIVVEAKESPEDK